jgi:hypothetical protein
VSLYAYHNPGEDVQQAVSTTDGQPYTALPTAFQYRREYNPACSCRAKGQSWAEAMKVGGGDITVEQGDIVVNEDHAKKLSQPRDAQGRLLKPTLTPTQNKTANAPADATEQPKGKIRSVGPTFVPRDN